MTVKTMLARTEKHTPSKAFWSMNFFIANVKKNIKSKCNHKIPLRIILNIESASMHLIFDMISSYSAYNESPTACIQQGSFQMRLRFHLLIWFRILFFVSDHQDDHSDHNTDQFYHLKR